MLDKQKKCLNKTRKSKLVFVFRPPGGLHPVEEGGQGGKPPGHLFLLPGHEGGQGGEPGRHLMLKGS